MRIRTVWLAAFLISMATTLDRPARAAPTPCSPASLPASRQVSVSPETELLPASADAQIVFHQPIGTSENYVIIDATEQNDLTRLDVTRPFPVVSVQPAPDKVVGGFLPTNSVALTVDLDAMRWPAWTSHRFLVLGCGAGGLAGWGLVSAKISDPVLSRVLCTILFATIYLFAIGAVILSSRSRSAIMDRYPAVFGVKQLSWRDVANPIHLAPDAFNKASVQKLQFLMFSFLVGWMVLSLVLRTGALAALSQSVLTLLGISGVGAVVAQAAHTQKTRLSLENWGWLEQTHALKSPCPPPGPRWRDLVLSNRQFDVYKLQSIIFSIAVAVGLIADGAQDLANFTVPQTLLGILGLSQVVFVGGVVAQTPTIADLDAALTKLRLAAERVEEAKLRGTDTGQDGSLLGALPAGGKPAANAQRQYVDLAMSTVPMIESALEVSVDPQALGIPAPRPSLVEAA